MIYIMIESRLLISTFESKNDRKIKIPFSYLVLSSLDQIFGGSISHFIFILLYLIIKLHEIISI